MIGTDRARFGRREFDATASDNVGVAGVQFLVNGTRWVRGHHRALRCASWNTTTVANGTYTVTARARDAAGNTTTSAPVSITVANGHHGTDG